MMAQLPSICRVVKYRDMDSRIHPAVVTSVVEGELVNLHVMMDGGGNKWVKDVPHDQLLSQPNSWSWPVRG